MSKKSTQQADSMSMPEASRIFAAIEQWGARIGFWLIIAGLGLYVSGVISPFLEIDELVRYWGLPADQFQQATGLPVGWDWLSYLHNSDMLGLLGLGLLSSAVIVAYMAIIPSLVRTKDYIYLVLVVLQVSVFVLAAGGWLTSGH